VHPTESSMAGKTLRSRFASPDTAATANKGMAATRRTGRTRVRRELGTGYMRDERVTQSPGGMFTQVVRSSTG
jgi:hypothetical protein